MPLPPAGQSRFREEMTYDGPTPYDAERNASYATSKSASATKVATATHERIEGVEKVPYCLNTGNIISHFRYGPYAFLPLLAAAMWFSGLLALLVLWIKDGEPRYSATEAKIAFISDVGGAHESFFLALCCVTDVFYFSSVCAIKWLRHTERLPHRLKDGSVVQPDLEVQQGKDTRWQRARPKVQFWASWLAILFCFVGCAGLFILAKWNAFDHPTIHWDGTLVFVLGVALSAICQTTEVWLLRQHHSHRRHLVVNSYAKLCVVGISVVCAIVFAGCYEYCHGEGVSYDSHPASSCDSISSLAAMFEWGIAFLLNAYFCSLAADLWPAGKSSTRYLARRKAWEGASRA